MTAIPTEEAPEPVQSAKYLYDGDGNLVKSVVNSVMGNTTTTYYPGKHYTVEEKNDNLKVQKHYAAGSTVIAVRTITAEADTLQWMISDHLGLRPAPPRMLTAPGTVTFATPPLARSASRSG